MDGGFVIPLTWGEDTDWFRNVRAAGGCTLHWHGRLYTLLNPEIVSGPEARSAFHPVERFLLKLVGVFVPLRMSEKNMEIGDVAEHGHEVYPSDVPSLGYPGGIPGIATGAGQAAAPSTA